MILMYNITKNLKLKQGNFNQMFSFLIHNKNIKNSKKNVF